MFFKSSLISLCSFLICLGCIEIQPSNPYDPNAPLSVQFKGTIKGTFRIQGEDLSTVTDTSYKLVLRNAQNQKVLNDQGEVIVYQTRTQADLDALDSDDEDAVIGSFEIQVETGTYSLLFEPVR